VYDFFLHLCPDTCNNYDMHNTMKKGARVTYTALGQCYLAEVVHASRDGKRVTVRDVALVTRTEDGSVVVRHDASEILASIQMCFVRRTSGDVTYYQHGDLRLDAQCAV
jgi:hypothetical protein